jgi:hypothetical protein
VVFAIKKKEGYTMKKDKLFVKTIVVVGIGCFVLLSCQTLPDPKIPPAEKQPTAQQARNVYLDHELSKVGSLYWGTYIFQGTDPYNYPFQRLSPLFEKSSDDALTAYKDASNLAIAAYITAGAGGACMGWPLGSYIATQELQTADFILLGTGVVLTTVSIVIGSIADGHLSLAVNHYNSELKLVLGVE